MGNSPLVSVCSSIPGLEMDNAFVIHGNISRALGLAVASGTSLVLWFGLVQVARWAAHTFL